MAQRDEVYSRIIAGLKILLPLLALGLLSTIFLLSRSIEPLETVPFSESSANAGAPEGVGTPFFSGTTQRGDTLTMSARVARPGAQSTIEAEEFTAQLRILEGTRYEMTAARAIVHDTDRVARLLGGVGITTSTGYTLTTEGLVASIDETDVESTGPVRGDGPFGAMSAGKMRIESTGEGDALHLLFTEGVKLVYDPKNSEK